MAQGAPKKTAASMLAVGMSPGKGKLGAFYVSPASRALPLAARYYAYGRYKSNLCFVSFFIITTIHHCVAIRLYHFSIIVLDRGRVSKQTFDDPEFRAMNQGFYA